MTLPNPCPPRVLIVDDEQDIRALLTEIIRRKGFEPFEAPDGTEALAALRQGIADVVLLDLHMPGMSGLEVLREARKFDRDTALIMVTGYGTIEIAVEAVKIGAYDFVTKPFDNNDLIQKIGRAAESSLRKRESLLRQAPLRLHPSLQGVMGSSQKMQTVYGLIKRVAPTDFTVIIQGETGSGKELVARAIHRKSLRANGPFVPVDCGAIQPNLVESELFGHERGAFTGADRIRQGKFEAAAGGTLFLDEVQNLPMSVQVKLLRALQERQICHVGGSKSIAIDLRVVVATNKDLSKLVAADEFRQDLYHRLNEFRVLLPSLRERREDILFLVKRFLDLAKEELCKESLGISSAALDLLIKYGWPGNVRELRNVIRRAVLLADDCIEAAHLNLEDRPAPANKGSGEIDLSRLDRCGPLKEIMQQSLRQVEREVLHQALKQSRGNKAEAARLLKIDYKTIHNKVRAYGLGRGEYSDDQENKEE